MDYDRVLRQTMVRPLFEARPEPPTLPPPASAPVRFSRFFVPHAGRAFLRRVSRASLFLVLLERALVVSRVPAPRSSRSFRLRAACAAFAWSVKRCSCSLPSLARGFALRCSCSFLLCVSRFCIGLGILFDCSRVSCVVLEVGLSVSVVIFVCIDHICPAGRRIAFLGILANCYLHDNGAFEYKYKMPKCLDI